MDEHSNAVVGGTGEGVEAAGAIGRVGARDALTEVLRTGAVDLLANAVRAEVAAWIDAHAQVVDAHGRRQVVRNGSMPQREIVTGIGPVKVKQPRVHDRRTPEEGREVFTSAILPPYLRKTRSMEELIPWLYLKGVSTGDFSEALAALIGTGTPGFSAATVTRLKESWEAEYRNWSTRDLTGRSYVYLWADGVHFNLRLGEQDRQCILVLMGATADGRKELLAIADGFRESEQSWKELLLEVKSRGLNVDPKLAIGDGALGFWKALPQVFTTTRTQRCWMHKTGNVLNKLPKKLHGQAKDLLHQVWMAPTKAAAEKSFDLFLETYTAKYASAAECLSKDREALLTFYDFPAEHWSHLRTTNAIESVFATVRLRTQKTKGSGSRVACLAMVFKLTESASKKWRCLNGSELIRDVIAGVVFVDGVKDQEPDKAAA